MLLMRIPEQVSWTARSRRSPQQVWRLLGHPARWPEFDLALAKVGGSAGEVEDGQRLVGLVRFLRLPLPVDVAEAVPGERLRLLVWVLPGLRELITFETHSHVRGGTSITVVNRPRGPLGRASIPVSMASVMVTSWMLARATERDQPSVRRMPAA